MRDLVNASCSTEAGYKDNSVEWRERYYRCLATNTRESGALGAERSLAGLSPEMRDLVNASCSTEAGYKDNSVEWRERYYRCLATNTRESGALGAEPSLAGLSPEMRDLVNASCSTEAGYKDNSLEWRERYYRCLATNTRESGALGAEPSLAGLSPPLCQRT